jgi:hypothetical protein
LEDVLFKLSLDLDVVAELCVLEATEAFDSRTHVINTGAARETDILASFKNASLLLVGLIGRPVDDQDAFLVL